MRVAIDIPGALYDALLNGYEEPYSRAFSDAIKNGTPFPKKHGRLIDADRLAHNAETCIETTDAFIDLINEEPTIVEAESEYDEIKVGDVCRYIGMGELFVVTRVYCEEESIFFDAVTERGFCINDGTLGLIEKTGRHIDIFNILKKIGGVE